MSEVAPKVVLITGASVGLGLALAKRLMKEPYRLVLTARTESLHRFKDLGIQESDQIKIRPLDILKEEERKGLVAEIDKDWGGVDILVNNAGFAYRSVLEHVQLDDLLQQMLTNFWAPMELVRLVLPNMRRKLSGKIINVSSVGGMMAMPTMSVYSASKFALEGASESLYYEVRPWNINVTLVEPGFIKSDSFKNTRYTTLSGNSMRDPSEPYYGHYRFMTEFIEKVMSRSFSTPDKIAKKIQKVIESQKPPLRVAATPDAYFFDLLRRVLPRQFYHWLLYYSLPYPDCWGDVDRLRARCGYQRHRVSTNPHP
jgi:short-subunit dehydrogenase